MDYPEEQGYHYSGGNNMEDLWHDESPDFVKTLETSEGAIYGYLNVNVHYDPNIKDYSFQFSAFLYPGPPARIVDDEGGLLYSVQLRDKQAFTKLNELPLMLEFYESKFNRLIRALREVDPVDGLS